MNYTLKTRLQTLSHKVLFAILIENCDHQIDTIVSIATYKVKPYHISLHELLCQMQLQQLVTTLRTTPLQTAFQHCCHRVNTLDKLNSPPLHIM